MRLTNIQLRHFKAFESFDMSLGPNAFLVGPNNAGKSTLIAAIRTSSELMRFAGRRKAKAIRRHRGHPVRAHEMGPALGGLVTENLRHQFRMKETSLCIRTDTELRLTAVWPDEDVDAESSPYFYAEHMDGRHMSEPAVVRRHVGEIGIIPSLSPLNQSERILDPGYVRDHYEGRRTSQHARNHLAMLDAAEWDSFKSFALEWLPELEDIEIDIRPGEAMGEKDIDVFIREVGDRTMKELFWAGDGMQVFIQLLSHCHRLRDADVIVLDEPDLYLHADLQRRLVRLLEGTTAQTITATHSPEMLAEAPSDSVLWVDKSRRRSVRRPAAATLEDLSSQIGSGFNLRLAAALRARTVLFVEGQDMTVLRRLASKVGAEALAEERGCAVIGMNGFSRWVHVEPFQWLLESFLEGAVDVFVLLDRDYRSDVQVQKIEATLRSSDINAHVWRRKELESYLLDEPAIARASGLPAPTIQSELSLITEGLTGEVHPEFIASRQADEGRSARAPSTVLREILDELDENSADPEWRLRRYPPKRIISLLNARLQELGAKTVSPAKLARLIRPTSVDPEMSNWLQDVNNSLSR